MAGLGNPGRKYESSRHNIGFLLADFIRGRHAENASWLSFGKGKYVKINLKEEDFYLVKPMMYMNNSGIMLRSFAEYFKIRAKQILVCYDDISLDFGKIRIRRGGSSGGHKGMESVIESFGVSDIPRLRIGIGRTESQNARNYVLGNFNSRERQELPQVLENSYNAFISIVNHGLEKAMNLHN